jgi:DNA polymerase-3 subunit gamma/tau
VISTANDIPVVNSLPTAVTPKAKIEQAVPDTLSTPKISLKNITVPKQEVKTKEEIPDNVVVNEEICQKIWEEFTSQLKQKGNTNAYMVFTNTKPLKVEEGWLHVGFTNPLQESILLELKWELQEFFSKKLNGQKIGLKPVLIQENQANTKKVLYTDEDKLRYLSEKHPVVDELKKKMGLDPNI